jgi:hypothetical protein
MSERFDPQTIEHFEYTSFSLDAQQGHLELHYALVGKQRYDFVEEVSLPGGDYAPEVIEVTNRLARLLFLAAGLSYYKAAAPAKIIIKTPVTSVEVDFLRQLIRGGMTEFAYVNNNPQALTPEVTAAQTIQQKPVELQNQNSSRPLVPVGGGKDSIVTIEALRAAGFTPLLFSVNSYEPIQKTVEVAQLPYTQAGRRLDPKLIQLNKNGAYNGHVPVTIINSLLALMVATLTNCDAVVFSNERSASEQNVMWQGIAVNHQWAKSLAAEQLLSNVVADIVTKSITYFSLLRPFSELRIARQFATLTKYHPVFTSCNKAFYWSKQQYQNWCGNCPKCRFVFLTLAPYMSKTELVRIFNKNLLDDEHELPGFKELLGIEGHKPLECVGEIAESRLALLLVAKRPDWQSSSVVKQLLAELTPDNLPKPTQQHKLLAVGRHQVPSIYQKALQNIQ